MARAHKASYVDPTVPSPYGLGEPPVATELPIRSIVKRLWVLEQYILSTVRPLLVEGVPCCGQCHMQLGACHDGACAREDCPQTKP